MAGEAETAERKLVLAHRALLDTRRLQLSFDAAPEPEPPPGWLLAILDRLGKALIEIAPLMKYVFWGGLAVGVLLVAWFAGREILGLRRPDRPRAAPADWRPDAGVARGLLAEADALAAAGRFDEAIHLILFRSIADLSRRRPGSVRPSLTSRDIARLGAMPQAPRDAFARIAAAVEHAVFAGRPVGAADFQACRRDFEAFAFADGWR